MQEEDKLKEFIYFLECKELKMNKETMNTKNNLLQQFRNYEDDKTLLNFLEKAYTEFGEIFGISEFEKANSGEYCFSFYNGTHYTLNRQTKEDLIEEDCNNCANEMFGQDEECERCWVWYKTSDRKQNNWLPICEEDVNDYD